MSSDKDRVYQRRSTESYILLIQVMDSIQRKYFYDSYLLI